MNAVLAVFWELIGLFVDDGSLAIAILMVVALAAVCASNTPHPPMVSGAILLLGCLGALVENVIRAGRRLS
jgi:hypothetical protein